MEGNTNLSKTFNLINSNDDIPEELLQEVRNKMNEVCEIPNQITPKQFFDYINASNNYNIFDKYKNSEEHRECYKYSFHGLRHVDNVSIFAYYIAEKENYSEKEIVIIMEAARFHDIGRTNDWEEGNHGFAGAKKYSQYCNQTLSENEIEIVKFLISTHDFPNIQDINPFTKQMFNNLTTDEIDKLCDMANIIRDADALDRTRFNVTMRDYLNPQYLIHNSAKEIIEVAQILNYEESKGQD